MHFRKLVRSITSTFLVTSSLFAANTFTTTGGTVVSNYWNASNTGGAVSIQALENPVDYVRTYMSVDGAAYTEITGGNGNITFGGTVNFSLTAANIESAGSLTDSETFHVYAVFTLGGVPADTIALTSTAYTVDQTVPSPSNVGTVVASGGNVVTSKWNSSNTALVSTVPIDNDASLLSGGTVQLMAKIGSNPYANLGTPTTITLINDPTKQVSIAAADVEALSGFADGQSVYVKAKITDAAGNQATGAQSGSVIAIDQAAPTIISVTSSPVSATLGVGDVIGITITFSEDVTLSSGTLDVTLETGASDAVESISAVNIDNASSASISYTVGLNEASSDLTLNSLALSGANNLRDASGNDAVLTIPGGVNLADNSAIVVDGVVPTIVGITSTSNDASPYAIGGVVNVTVTFSENVTLVGGNLLIALETGATDRTVTISSISNTTTATGTYTVQSGDESSDLSAKSPLTLSGGSLQDVAGNDVTMTFTSNINDASDLVIDGVLPSAVNMAGGSGTVVATGGTVVADYWNNTNTALSVTLPIADDASLLLGSVQLKGYWGVVGGAQNLGSASSIGATGSNKTISIPAATLEAFGGFEENAVLKIIAIVTDNAGNVGTVGTESDNEITIDQTAPTVAGITSTTPNGYVIPASAVNVTLTFSEPVNLAGGNLLVEFETGSTDETATISTISSSLTATGIYTVQVGNNSSDLNVNLLSLSAGSLRDDAGNSANLTLPVGANLADNSGIIVDGIIPTIVGISSDSNDGDYAIGDVVNIIVQFSEAVTLAGGSLQIQLETGTSDRLVSISTISNATTASGTYTVQSGDENSDLYANSPLTLSAGTLKDIAGNNVTLTFTSNIDDGSAIVIDGNIPDAVDLAGGAGPVVTTGGTLVTNYWNSTNTFLSVTVPIAADASLVDGSVQLKGYWGVVGGAQNLGTAQTISATGQNMTILISAATLEGFAGFAETAILKVIALVTDKAGNQSAVGSKSNNEIIIDQTAPTITNITSTNADGYVIPTNTVNVTVTYSEAVTLAGGNLSIVLETGTIDETVTISTINSTVTAQGTYTVQEGNASADLTAKSFSLTAGSLRDAAGNAASMSLPVGANLADNKNIQVDGILPTILSITSDSNNGDYGIGDEINVIVTFSEDVTLSAGGSLQIEMETGATDRSISISSFTASTTATGTYTVQTDDVSSDLSANSPATLGSGTLKDIAGNNVDLTFTSNINTGSALVVDGVVPDAVNLAAGAGTVIATGGTVVANYWNATNTALSVVVPIAADPSLIGGTVQLKGYWGVVGGAQNLGTASSIASTGQNKTISIASATLETFAGFDEAAVLKIIAIVTDKAGNSSAIGSESDAEITIDQIAPTISSLSSTNADGYVIPGNDVNITVTFSEAVSLAGGNFRIQLETGTSDQTVTISSINTSLTAVGTYTVIAGHESLDLSANSVSLSAGTLRDAAGNNATLSIPVGSNLNDFSDIVIDGVIPTILSVTSDSPDDEYAIGDEVNIVVTFSEAVTLTGGNLQVELQTGSVERTVSITSFSNSTTAEGTYTVQIGDESSDLSANSPLTLSAGSLRDLAGNDVTLSFPIDISTGSDIVIDGIVPSAVNMAAGAGTAIASGGTVVSNYWNGTNLNLNVTVPIAADASLIDGTLQLKGYWGLVGGAQNLGSASIINATGTNKAVIITGGTLEAFPGYTENAVLKIIAIVTDKAGNVSPVGSESDNEIRIDKTAPTISSLTSTTPDGYAIIGDDVNVTVTFSEAVTLAGGNLRIVLETGASDPTLTVSAINASLTAEAIYTVLENHASADLTATGISLSAGTLSDAAGNGINPSLPIGSNLADNSNIVVDGVIPTVVSVTSSDVSGLYGKDDVISLIVTFSEAVSISGSETLNLDIDASTTNVQIAAFTNSITGTKNYTVLEGDESADLTVTAMSLSGGTLTDQAGNEVDLSDISGITNLDDAYNFEIDGILPLAFNMVSGVATGTNSIAGYWNGTNSGLNVTVAIPDDASLQDGLLQIRGRIAANSFVSLGAPSTIAASNANKTVLIDDGILDLLSGFDNDETLSISAILTDVAGNSTTANVPSILEIEIDEAAPTITAITSTTNDGSYSLGEVVNVTVALSENVTLNSGTMQVTLNTTAVPHVLTDNAIVNESSISYSYTIQNNEAANPLTVTGVTATANQLLDQAGNEVDFTLPVGNNLANNSTLIVDGEFPSIVSISATVVADTLGLGETIDIDIEFNEPLTLIGGTFDITLDMDDVDRILSIPVFTASSSTSATYVVAVGESAADLTVSSVALSGGTLQDIAGNALPMTLPVGANLGNNNNILVDGILPTAFQTGSVLTVGAPVVTGYWNALNTGLQVILPVTGLDPSLNGGTAYLEARVNGNAFESIGTVSAVGTNPVTKSLSRAQLEADLAGYLAGGTIQVRGVLTDIAGNATIGAVSTVELIIDQVSPTQTVTGALVVSGGTEIQGYWNPTNTNLLVSTDLDNDNTLLGGTIQLQMQIGSGGYLAVGSSSTINAVNTTLGIDLNATDLSSLATADGQTIHFRALVTDIAGNVTTGTEGVNTILVDLTGPDVVTVGTVIATAVDGVVVVDAFNASNDGISVRIPISNDVTLMGGQLITQLKVGAEAYVDVNTSGITAINTNQDIFLSRALLTGLTGWSNGITLRTSVILIDRAGNETQGLPSGNLLMVDEIVPIDFVINNLVPVGVFVKESYWNSSNTGVLITVPIDGTDLSLIGGNLKASGDIVADGIFEVFSVEVPINAATGTLSITVPAADLEVLDGGGAFLNGQDIEFRAIITDAAGNETVSATSTQVLEIDRGLPAAPAITKFTIKGTNIRDMVWSAGADSLLLTIPINTTADPTLVGGFMQVQMSVGTTSADNPYYTVLSDSFLIPTFDDTVRIAAADLEALPDYSDLNLYTRVLIQDIAGNETIGVSSAGVILIDTNAPADFSCGSLTATGGNVVTDAYNNSNSGIALEVPIANDPTLTNGRAIIRVGLRNLITVPPGPVIPEYIDTVSISAINTTLLMTLDHATLSALPDFNSNYEMFVTADLLDYAGNQVEGTASLNVLTLDFLGPDLPFLNDTTTVGGTIVAGYWNASNTGIRLLVATPTNVDTSLENGYFQIQGLVGSGTFLDLGAAVSIVSRNFNELAVNIDAVDVESLPGFGENLPLHLRVKMVDGRGNDTVGVRMDTLFWIDQVAPVTGAFNLAGTTTDRYINAEDTLKAKWVNFGDTNSGIAQYEFSVGHTAGVDDFLGWDTLSGTAIDTLLLYSHAADYFLNVRAWDVAGNLSDILSSSVITADLLLPTTTSDMERYYFIDDWPGTLTGSYADELSEVESVDLVIKRASDDLFWNGTQWAANDSLLSLNLALGVWNYPLAADSLVNREEYIIYLMGQDIAGNRQSGTSPVTATVDTFQFVENQKPFFVDGASYSGSSDEDSQYTRIYLADDVDLGSISSDTLYYSLSEDAPAGVLIDSLTGQLTWLPVDSAVGIHNFEAYVEDYYGLRDTLLITHEVLEVNDAPEAVMLLLPPDSTQLVPEDSLLLTFRWTPAFDIEGDIVAYRVYFQGGAYSNVMGSPDTFLTVDVSVMDFPVDTIEWFVEAYDQEDVSAIDTIFHFNTSAALAELNTDSIAVDMARHTDMDTLFVMSNLGLTDLRWTLLSAPSWITFAVESGTVEYQASSDIAFNIDLAGFTIGGYGGDILLTTNDPLHDTIKVDVTMEIFEIPAPVIAFYKNMAFPAFYELMIVDSLGMIEELSISHAGEDLEITAVDTFSYVATVEVAAEGFTSFEFLASNWVGDTTITASITVSLIKPGARWLARSPDNNFEIQGNAKSVLTGSRITILDSLLSATDHARYQVLTDGVELAEAVRVSMPMREADQAIYRQDQAGEFFELPSISDGERVTAWAEQMSAFKTGPRTIIVPERSRLSQNYPNPFNPSTTIDFDIGFLDGLNQDVGFSIYNIRGQEVRTLMESQLQPGSYSVSWNGLDDQGKQVSSGIYFARLMTGKGYVKTVKMLVLR